MKKQRFKRPRFIDRQDKFIRVSLHLKVDGRLERRKIVAYYKRGKETYAFTLDDFARIVYSWDHIFGSSSTYAHDGLMQQMENKLPKKKDETAESVFQRYWINMKQTVSEEFEDFNKGGDNRIFKEPNDYFKYIVAIKCDWFDKAPLPVKYAFLYFLFKYMEGGSFDDLKDDIEKIPEEIKSLVDSLISKE